MLEQNKQLEGLKEALREHKDLAYRVCLYVTGNPDDAEDAFQDGCVRLLSKRLEFASVISARAWICAFMKRAALNVVRGRKRVDTSRSRFAMDNMDKPSPYELAQQAEIMGQVRKVMTVLPLPDRMALKLHYDEGLSHLEVAQALGCRENAARMRITRALEKIRRKIGMLTVAALALLLEENVNASERIVAPAHLADWMEKAFLSPPAPALAWRELVWESLRKGVFYMVRSPMTYVALVAICTAGVFINAVANSRGQETCTPAAPNSKVESHNIANRENTRVVIDDRFLGADEGKAQPIQAAAEDEKKKLAEGNNAFAADLYAQLVGKEKGNLFFSPYSIRTALAMTYAGAKGKTAEEMRAALRFNLEDDRLFAAFKAVRERLDNQGEGSHTLSIANSLWGQQGYAFLQPFLDANKTYFGGGLNVLDFKTKTEESRKTINLWVESKTNDKIKDLIPQGGVTPATRLVLANAVYFFGFWERQFDKELTQDADFFVKTQIPGKQSDDSSKATPPAMLPAFTPVKVKMMSHRVGVYQGKDYEMTKFRYIDTDQMQAVELPYNGGEVSMVVFLPKDKDGLATIEKELAGRGMNRQSEATARKASGLFATLAELDQAEKQKVIVKLPKWKMTWGTKDLGPAETNILPELGMKDAFVYPAADFSGMDGGRELYIGAVFHKAFIDVNEEGTEAAAATAVVAQLGDLPQPPQQFIANHPFLYVIRENVTGSILFMGRVTNPLE